MKKQTQIVTKTLTNPQATRKEWMLLAGIVALVYRNQSNRSVSTGVPPGALKWAKETILTIISDAEKLISKLAVLFYNINGESFNSFIQWSAIAGLIISVMTAVLYATKKSGNQLIETISHE